MSFRCGLVGLPNVGKTTLFNALTGAGAQIGNFPFTTVDRNVGVTPVPDDRLELVWRMAGSRTATPATVEFTDIAGLVEGASRGEGLGNRFLAHVREVDAILHVVRCFADPRVGHVRGEADPIGDIEAVNVELAVADLEAVERRREKVARQAKGPERKKWEGELAVLGKVHAGLAAGRPVRALSLAPEERDILRPLFLLTDKPVLYAVNISEESTGAPGEDPCLQAVEGWARQQGARVVPLSARIEAELAELPPAERLEFMADLGLEESGRDRLVREAHRLLDLVTFFTANENEARAWTLARGSRAPRAAGKVHTDMEAGFICAEVVATEDLRRAGSLQAAREQGLIRLEGRDYEVRDGDLLYFRFRR